MLDICFVCEQKVTRRQEQLRCSKCPMLEHRRCHVPGKCIFLKYIIALVILYVQGVFEPLIIDIY